MFYFPDQVRVQDVSYNGGKNVNTSHIDRLASQSRIFTNAISSCPLCTPYRAMLQTGRWPTLTGGMFNFTNLPATGQSMADVFSRSGYRTGFIGKWHLSAGRLAGTLQRGKPASPLKESEFTPPGPARHGYQHWEAYNFHANFAKAFYYKDTSERLIMPRYETDSETDMAIDFMRSRSAPDDPFFLVVAPHPPHPPWRRDQAPQGSLDRIPDHLYWRPNVKGRQDAELKDPHCYYAMLGNVDDNVGRLMKFLDESGLADNTIVVFTSDHGEMLASHGRYNKMVPYEEAIGVPLSIRWPKHIAAGSRSDALFTPMDHFPTLAGLCGVEVPQLVDGMDLSGVVLSRRNANERDGALIMNYSSHWDYPETQTDWPEWRGVRTKQHTYVRWLNGPEELYDNLADPYQMKNLFNGQQVPQVMTQLRARLNDLLKDSRDEFLPGTTYASWLTPERDWKRTAAGPIPG